MTASIFPENKVTVPFSAPAITAVIDRTYPAEEYFAEVLRLISGLTNRDVTGRAHDLIMGDKELLMLADSASDELSFQLKRAPLGSGLRDSVNLTGVTFNVQVYETLA